MPFFYYYDPYYWMILVPAMLIALLAQLNVSSTFNRYSRMASRRGFTGAQAAEAVLRAHGIQNVRIERVSGRLTDHYDPRSNVIRLSDAVYGSNSIASDRRIPLPAWRVPICWRTMSCGVPARCWGPLP